MYRKVTSCTQSVAIQSSNDGDIRICRAVVFDDLHRIDNETPPEVQIMYCGNRVFLSPNLKWRYADQNDSR